MSVEHRPERPLVLISGKQVIDEAGGHPSYVRAHALAAIRCGWAPHIFCLGARARTDATPYGAVHTIAPARGARVPVALQPQLFGRAVTAFLRDRPGPHLIHGFAIWSGAAVAAAAALGRLGVPTTAVASAYATRAYEVGTMPAALGSHHGGTDRVRYRLWLQWVRLIDDAVEGRGYRRARTVLVNYDSVRRLLIDAYGGGLPIRRMPYASAAAFDPPAPPDAGDPPGLASLRPTDSPLIVAVSRQDPRKGIDVLLLALAELARRGVAFRACIVGTGRLLAAHRRLAGRLGLDARVSLPGEVAEVEPYLQRADIFALPSWGEASGSVSVLEAMQAGAAIVASDCDGIPEDLSDGIDALLVPPGDVRRLAAALEALLADPVRRGELGTRAAVAHRERFSAERFTAALAATYSELGFAP